MKLQKLRVERRILQLLDDARMRVLIGFKPQTLGQWRCHLAAMLILDTGLRVSLTAGASVLDVSRSTLKRWRRGQKSLPIVA